MRLAAIVPEAPPSVRALEVTGLAYDHEAAAPGTLFFCLPGYPSNRRDAIARGAVAMVAERPLALGVPEILVADAHRALAAAASRFYGDPSAELQVVGVTGTNGKTTTANLVRLLLEADHRPTGFVGTVKHVIGGVEHLVDSTTPAATELQRALRSMADGGDVACAIEISSHALVQRRADAIQFAVAIFTNLTRDHLDFHRGMEEYFQAKRRLFVELEPRLAVVNLDDPHGRRLAAELRDPITYAIDHDAIYTAREVRTRLDGTSFDLCAPGARLELHTPLIGRHNVYNVLGALAATRALGVPLNRAAAAIGTAQPVPGRFELVDVGQPFAVLVDYAHTPDALENALRTARELVLSGRPEGRLHVVFGCGGDRDRSKRPAMGEIAGRLGDHVIVTSDNPRSEDPAAIIEEILAGTAAGALEPEIDRRAAIFRAIAAARPGDVVLIAGKGHEQTLVSSGGRGLPFDDVTVARSALRRLRGAAR
jgi:UDP-N-acetylmuramoyl-L-alanyl-D-glutamate--2,6-diaminopimelate ligase